MCQKFVTVSHSYNKHIQGYTETCLQDIRDVHNNKHTEDLCFYVLINFKFEIVLFF